MNSYGIALALAWTLGATVMVARLQAAETPSTKPNPQISSRDALREQLKNMTPEERDAKLKELRAEYSEVGPKHEYWEKKRDELKDLPPEEREKKVRDWRGTNAPVLNTFTEEEREAKRKAIRNRLSEELKKLKELEKKGTITPEEKRRLTRMEEVAKTLDEGRPIPGFRKPITPQPETPAPELKPEQDQPAPAAPK